DSVARSGAACSASSAAAATRARGAPPGSSSRPPPRPRGERGARVTARRRVEDDAREPSDAAVGNEEARALEVEHRRRRGRIEDAGRGAAVEADARQELLQAADVRAARLRAERGPEPLEVAPE